jgi:hypothetical protein
MVKCEVARETSTRADTTIRVNIVKKSGLFLKTLWERLWISELPDAGVLGLDTLYTHQDPG